MGRTRPAWQRRFSRWTFAHPVAGAAVVALCVGVVEFAVFRDPLIALVVPLVLFVWVGTLNVRRKRRTGTVEAWEQDIEEQSARMRTPGAIAHRRKVTLWCAAAGVALGGLLVLAVRVGILGP